MNHHEFRQFVTELPSDKIRLSNINPAHFKAVCFVLSMYGDYGTGTEIYPSWLTVSKKAGVNRKTAFKVRDYLIKEGILIKKKTNQANIDEYIFGEKSILEEQKSLFDGSEVQIDGPNITIDTTIEINKRKINQEILEEWNHSTLSDWTVTA